jgi:antitoxin MazE
VVRRLDDLLSKPLSDEAGLSGEVEIHAEPERTVVALAMRPRAGWRDAARRMVEQGEDTLIDPHIPTEFDAEEWMW